MKLKKFIASTLGILSLCSSIRVFAILPNGEDESWLKTDSGIDWLQSVDGLEWLNSADGRLWLKSEAGRQWLKSDNGKAWRRENHHCIIA